MDLFVVDNQGEEDILPAEDEEPEELVLEEPESDQDDADFDGLPPPSKDISHILDSALVPARPPLIIARPADVTKKERRLEWQRNLTTDSLLDDIIHTKYEEHFKDLPYIETSTGLEKNAMSERKLLKLRRAERANTKGKGWFGMKAPELTEETRNELELIKMRASLDSKRFYKRNESKVLPKFFEIGKVVPSPLDHYQERNEKNPKTLVDELLADAEFQKRNKRKYREALEHKKSSGYYKAQQKMKKLKKRK